MRAPVLALAAVMAAGLLSSAAGLQEKGGEEETGPYRVVENWPTPWARQGYIWGSQPGVFADTPGFIDAHVHFTGVGEAARNLKLSTARNWDDIVRMVAEAAKKARPGEWILGRGWHQEK